MITKGLAPLNNGNEVIAFTNGNVLGKKLKSLQDLPSLYSWYTEDPNKNHLGLMKFWDFKTTRPSGILDELMTTSAMLEVDGWNGGFTYDTPVETDTGCYTTKDMSFQKFAGIDGATFKIILNKEYSIGDVLTYDVYKGFQIVVVEETVEDIVKQVAEGWEHTVTLASENNAHYFPEAFLQSGVQYFKVNHAIDGERGTKFSGFEFGEEMQTMRHEFRLGAMTGVESYITGMASEKSFSGADAQSKQFIDKIQSEFAGNDIIILSDTMKNASGISVPNPKTARLGSTMEYLTMRELQRLTNSKLMWQSAATIRNTNGVTRINEGLYKQMLRGTIHKYGRKGGITRQHLIDMGTYIYRNNDRLDDFDRHLEFRCGKYAFENVLEIFDKEIQLQMLSVANRGLLGSETLIPNPVKGKDPLNLEFGVTRFTKVFIKGLGHLRIIHDKSLDNADKGMDRRVRGDNPEGYAPTTFSIFVTDVSSQQYSNNRQLPKGTTLVDGGREGGNIYLVKPKGEMTFWGTTNGRYDYRKAGDVTSSMKQIGQEFWAFNIMDIIMLDPSLVLILELDENAQRY